MADENDPEGLEPETPSALRSRMEDAIARAAAAESKLATFETAQFLVEKKFDLVKAEDLTGVAPAEREAKAAEIQASRKTAQDELLRKALEARGFDEDSIEEMLNQEASAASVDEAEAEAASRIRRVGELPGKVVPAVNPDKLHAEDALLAAFQQDAKKARR